MTTIAMDTTEPPGAASGRRLVLYLSGKWDVTYARDFGPDDLLFCAPGFSEQAPDFDWHELPRLPRGSFYDLAKAYTDLLQTDGDDDLDGDLAWALANTQFEYGVCPIAALLLEIDRLIDAEAPRSLVVIASKSSLRHIPAIGVVTKESSRGSPNLLGALAARAIVEAKLDLPVEWVVTRGDPLCVPAIRYSVFRLATIALILLAAIRIMRSPIGTWEALRQDCQVVVGVRSAGQAGHASRIFGGIGRIAALVIPQFTGRNMMHEIARVAGERLTVFRPTNRDLLRALRTAIFARSRSAGRREGGKSQLAVGRFRLPVSRAGLIRELRLFPILRYHKALMELSLARLAGLRTLVGFEIKGPFATVEAMAGRSAGLRTAAVQTVLVPPRPLPVFPWPDLFFADAVASADTIRQIGQRNMGQVAFVGSPHVVEPIRSSLPLRSVVFLSQPYETPQALSLVQTLVEAARHFGFKIRIRLHPRDDRENYRPVLEGAEDVLAICDRNTLAESISGADLCVTRVSSSAKEALAAGNPVVICLWSEYDRSIVADYIARDDLAARYITTDSASLWRVLGNADQLVAASVELQARLFKDDGVEAIREAVLG